MSLGLIYGARNNALGGDYQTDIDSIRLGHAFLHGL
jgi:hypothetical protein